MNEASSKYVDQIATEKLINEKLKLVHHAPDGSGEGYDTSLDDFVHLAAQPKGVVETRKGDTIEISFPSAIHTAYAENDQVTCRCALSANPRGDLIFVHGLYEDNVQIYNFFISMLNRQGLNVYSLTLPFHYERRPATSSFSGEFFMSGSIHRSLLAFKQAVYDLYQLYHYVKSKTGGSVGIVGFSMGGGIVLCLASLTALDGVFAINPVCNITELVWHSALFSTIKQDLEASGFSFEDVQSQYRAFEPLNVDHIGHTGHTRHTNHIKTARDRVVVAQGLYDQINDPQNYDLLVKAWNVRHVLSYKAGHLNILRVPKLAPDVARFYYEERAP